MFKKISSVLLIGLVAGLVTGCGGDEPDPTASAPPPLPPPAAEPAPEPAPTGASVLANLTPPTNPEARIKAITQAKDVGRSNPFLGVSPPVAAPGLKTQEPPPPLLIPGEFVPVSQINQRIAELIPPEALPGRPGMPRPEIPPPKDAEGVQLFGVAVVAGSPQAIVRAPGEAVTRTVQIGDLLANGVRVQNILAYGPTPAIVLEQFGQKVTVGLGQTKASNTMVPL